MTNARVSAWEMWTLLPYGEIRVFPVEDQTAKDRAALSFDMDSARDFQRAVPYVSPEYVYYFTSTSDN